MLELIALFRLYKQPDWRQVALWFVSLTIIGFFLSQTAIADNKDGDLAYWEPWLLEFSAVYSYGLLCPIIIVYCKKWLLENEQVYKSIVKLLVLYIPFTVLFISLMMVVRNIGYFFIDGHMWNSGDLLARYIYEFPKSIPFYFAVVFSTYTKIYFTTYQKERIHAVKLNEKLLTAQVSILRNQLQPHFLFNTLNLISSTMYQDVDKADSIITRLGDLLRYSLASEQRPWVAFKQEMQAMNSYLEIAQLRFGDRIKINVEIESAVESVKIPSMLLQPLLENAIKYGIEPSDEEGEISISAKLVDNKLHIMMSNPNLNDISQQPSFGIGLKNTKERLSLLFGVLASLTIDKTHQSLIILRLILPITESALKEAMSPRTENKCLHK